MHRLLSVRIGLALHLLAAVILCFLPLFDVLGFERAFVTGLIAAPIAAAIGVGAVRQARRAGGDDLGRIFGATVVAAGLLAVPTVAAGAIVELVRQPCSPGEGALFVLLCAGGGTVFGAAAGVCAATVGPHRALPPLLITAIFAADLATALARLYNEPQIFVYSFAFGFWPGSLYDENLPITVALWGQRGLTALVAGAMVAWFRSVTDRPSLLVFRAPPRPLSVVAAAALTACAWATNHHGAELGFAKDRTTIEAALARHVDRPTYALRVDPSISAAQLSRLEDDVALRYQQLERFFHTRPDGPIRIYVYRSTDQKKQLMGASRTQIARPWSREIHIHGFEFPHRTLKHELAHVFAGALASGPFAVPAAAGVLVNVGVVEGIAVAADWPARQMTVHGWARAMRQLGLAPDPRVTLYPAGFWATSSSRAYTTAGSFIRFLIDQYGIDAFAALYRGNDFHAAYSRSLDALVSEWEAFMDGLPLDDVDLLIAEHRFKQPGVFQKVCAHTTAALARRGYNHLAAGDLAAAAADLEQVADNQPNSVQALLALSAGFAKRGDLGAATVYAERARDRAGISAQARAAATSALADLAWTKRDIPAARAAYEAVRLQQSGAPEQRLTLAKLAILERPEPVQAVLRPYLLGALPRNRALVELGELYRSAQPDGLVAYLYARMLEGVGAYDRGLAAIRSAITGGLPGAPLEIEAQRTLGRLLLAGGKASEAAAHYDAMARAAGTEVDRMVAEDAAEMARIRAARTSTAGIEVDSSKFER